jgi:hypothetical protein
LFLLHHHVGVVQMITPRSSAPALRSPRSSPSGRAVFVLHRHKRGFRGEAAGVVNARRLVCANAPATAC